MNPLVSFTGKNVLVTGVNTGLGFEAAFEFARLRASRLILAFCMLSNGEAAKARIFAATGRKDDFSIILQVDLTDLGKVKAFVLALEKETDYLDVALFKHVLLTRNI